MGAQEKTAAASVTQIAPDVRQVSVGAPFRSHVYLIDGPDGPIAFDTGIKGGTRRFSPPRAGRWIA